MQPDVSIIIPTFNSVQFIHETLNSLLAQTHNNWECIVVDDASTDSTISVVESYIHKDSRITFYKRPTEKPKGANACRNFGISRSKGEFVLFLDSDDILSSNCLENRLNVFMLHPNCDFVVADTALLINGDFKDKSINKDTDDRTSKTYLSNFFSYNLPWTIMSVLWKAEIIHVYQFDESLLRFQDVDFHINVLKHNYSIERLNSIDNYYRVNDNKIANAKHIKSVLENLLIFFDKHIEFVLSNPNYRMAFQKFINYFLFHYMFVNYDEFKDEVLKILKRIYNSGLYSDKELRLIKTNEFLVKTKLSKTKYIGMHTFSKFIKRKLENI